MRPFEYPDEFKKIFMRIHHVGVVGLPIALHSIQEHVEEDVVFVVAAVGDAIDAPHEIHPSFFLFRIVEVVGDPHIKREGGGHEVLL